MAEPAEDEGFVDLRQRLEVGDGDTFVDHVHGLADEAEFDDRAIVLDEPRIGGAAGGRKLRLLAGTASTAPDSDEISALLRVRKTWLGRSFQVISYRTGSRPARSAPSAAARSRRAMISAIRLSAVQVSLKRMLKHASPSPE